MYVHTYTGGNVIAKRLPEGYNLLTSFQTTDPPDVQYNVSDTVRSPQQRCVSAPFSQ